jgi:hypothetical protein
MLVAATAAFTVACVSGVGADRAILHAGSAAVNTLMTRTRERGFLMASSTKQPAVYVLFRIRATLSSSRTYSSMSWAATNGFKILGKDRNMAAK